MNLLVQNLNDFIPDNLCLYGLFVIACAHIALHTFVLDYAYKC